MSLSLSSLLDELYDAEFRGVPFHMPDAREETGRRVVRFLFPGRDDGWHEDLGALDGRISVSGIIIGEDYIRRANRLRAAFREPGPGLLTHPWLGDMDVVLAEPAEISFSYGELRLARFTAAFEPFIERPPVKLDTLGQLLALLDAVREGARRLLRWVLAPVRLAVALVRAVAGFAGAVVGFFRSALGTLRGAGRLPGLLAAPFDGLLSTGTLRGDAGFAAAVAARLEAPGAVIRAAAVPPLRPAIGTFTGAAQAAAEADAFAATRLLLLVAAAVRADAAPASLRLATQALLLADAVQVGVDAPFRSQAEAVAMRGALDVALATLAADAAVAAAADPAGAGAVWQAAAALRAGLARDMSARIGRLPAVVTLRLPAAAPTWLVAQHLAGERPGGVAAQVTDLLARNRPRGVGRLPAGPVEALL